MKTILNLLCLITVILMPVFAIMWVFGVVDGRYLVSDIIAIIGIIMIYYVLGYDEKQ